MPNEETFPLRTARPDWHHVFFFLSYGTVLVILVVLLMHMLPFGNNTEIVLTRARTHTHAHSLCLRDRPTK
jgi:hypothetical protein